MDSNVEHEVTTSQLSIQNEQITFKRTVHQLSKFKGKNLIKQLIQISEENNFDNITFKSAYKEKELKILERLLFSAGFIIKEFVIEEESKVLTLTIMSESRMRLSLANEINFGLSENANIIIRDIYGEGDVGVYRDERYRPEASFIGKVITPEFKGEIKSDGAISSWNGSLRRNDVPPIVVEVGATQSELSLFRAASTWFNYEESQTNIDAVLLCKIRREVRPEIEDKRGADSERLEKTRLKYIKFVMFLREHRTALRTGQELPLALQLNYCSAATVHVTYPAEGQFHLEFIQPPHSIYNCSISEGAPAVDGNPNTISIPRRIIDPDLQSGIDDYIAILTNLDIMDICKRGVLEMERIAGRGAQLV